jgi:hypothetical protein
MMKGKKKTMKKLQVIRSDGMIMTILTRWKMWPHGGLVFDGDLNHPAGSADGEEVPIPEVHFVRGAMLENMIIN